MRRQVEARTVELCGPPGAGKSSITRHLAACLTARGAQVSEPLARVAPSRPVGRRVGAKVLVASSEVLLAPVDSARALAAIHRSGQPIRDALHRSLNWLVVRGLYRRARSRPGIHLFDQGIVQELCSLAHHGGDWRACLAAAGPGRARLGPDLLIGVVAPVETALARLDARPGHQSRLERLPSDVRRTGLERQYRVVEEVEEAWFDHHGAALGTRRTQVCNDDGGLQEAVEALVVRVLPPAT